MFGPKMEFTRFRGVPGLYLNSHEAVADHAIKSLLATGTRHNGASTFPHGLKIDGVYEGDLVVPPGRGIVWVSESGRIKGTVKATQVYVQGIVDGTVEADVIVLEGQGAISGQMVSDFVIARHCTVADMRAKIVNRAMGAKLERIGSNEQGLVMVAGGR